MEGLWRVVRSVAWVSLDEGDNAPAQLGSYVIPFLEGREPR